MTISSTDSKDQVAGDGVTKIFPYSFRVDRTQDFQVWVDETEMTYGSDYGADNLVFQLVVISHLWLHLRMKQ